MKKSFVVTAAILILAGLVVIGAVMVFSGFSFQSLDGTKYAANTYTPRSDFSHIYVNTDITDIEFAKADDGQCRVECFETDKIAHCVSVENGRLVITSTDSRKWYEHIGFFSKSQRVTVYLPVEEYGALTVIGSTGDVSVPADFTFYNADIELSTGNVKFLASTGKDLNIKTGTGDIEAGPLRAENLSLTVSTGRVGLDSVDCGGEVSIQVSTGRTDIKNLTCRSLYSDGSTGKITMEKVTARENLTIERTTGDVRLERVDAGEIKIKTSTGDVTGTLLTEKIFITETSTGRVKVPKGRSGGLCEITTSTGDIEIEITNGE